MRILHIVPDLVPYGAERVVGTLATQGARRGARMAVASLYEEFPGSLSPELRREGVRVYHLNKRRGFDVRMFHRIFGVLRDFRPDVVHTHNYVLRYVLPTVMLHNPPAVVHTVHNMADREVDRLGVWLQRHAFAKRVQPVVISEEGAVSFERVYPDTARPPLVRNGIDVARFAEMAKTRERWRSENGFSASDVLIVCVARLYEQKNHKTLIEAFARLATTSTGCKLLLAGDGHLHREVEAQVRTAGLQDRVYFLGRRDDIPEILGASDIFALASLWEGNPLSVMEAMAAGLPVAVTAVGGVPELARHEQDGFVVAPGDAEALAAALRVLIDDPAKCRGMGTAAALRAQTAFDDKNMVEAYESLYDEILPAPVETRGGQLAIRRSTPA